MYNDRYITWEELHEPEDRVIDVEWSEESSIKWKIGILKNTHQLDKTGLRKRLLDYLLRTYPQFNNI